MSENVHIAGIGTYFPKEYIYNYDIANKYGYDISFLKNKIGFEKLLRKAKGETVVDFCLNAFNDLKKKTEFDNKEIGLITVVTQHPDNTVPHISAILHNRLNMAKECMTFDISQGCSGYCHALEITKNIMITNNIKKSLIFTCDLYSKIVNKENKNVNMIFGDASTSTLLNLESGMYYIQDSNFETLPNSNECLTCIESLEMNGNEVFNYVCSEVPLTVSNLLEKNSLSKEDVGYFVFHQGTKFMVDFLKKIMKIPDEKTEFSATNIGNTVSSSIPIQLKEILNNRDTYDYIVLSGFGVGFTVGNILLKRREL